MKKNNLEIALEILNKPEGHTTVLKHDGEHIVFKCNKCQKIYKQHKSYIVRKYEILNKESMCSNCCSNRTHQRKSNKTDPIEVFYETHSRDEYEVLEVFYDEKKNKCLKIKHLICGSIYISTCYSACHSNCPNCKRLSSTNNLLFKKPKLVEKFWDYEKNTILPEHVTPNSNKFVHIKCKDCGTESFVSVESLKAVCQHCKEQKKKIKQNIQIENSLIKEARNRFDQILLKTLKTEKANILSERERKFLILFFEYKLPMNTIGINENITRERVRQILLEAMNKIELLEKYKEIYTFTNLK